MTALAGAKMDITAARLAAVRETTAALKAVLGRGVIGRAELDEAKSLLLALAERQELDWQVSRRRRRTVELRWRPEPLDQRRHRRQSRADAVREPRRWV